MTPRELVAAINDAKVCMVWVTFGPRGEGRYIDVSKRQALDVAQDAKFRQLEEVDAVFGAGVLRIGSEIELECEEDGPRPVCSECGEDFEDGHECSA